MANIGKGAVQGQVNFGVTAVSAAYTVVGTDELVQVTPGASAIAISLPAPVAANGLGNVGNQGQRVTVQKVGAGAGNVVVDGVLPSYIRAAGKSTLASNGSSVTYICDGAFWNCLGAVS
jgi:hypothetical protein